MSTAAGTRRLQLIGLLLFSALAVTILVVFVVLSGARAPGTHSYTLHATVPNAISLSPKADVLQAGVRVGQVEAIAVSGAAARITFTLRDPPAYRDARVRIRAKSLAGENYLDLAPGHPAAGRLADGGSVRTRAPETTQLDQILSTLDRPRRDDVKRILDALGTGLDRRGPQLNETLAGAGELVGRAVPVAAVLEHDRRQVATLVDSFGVVAGALGRRRADIHGFVRAAHGAAAAAASRETQLRKTLRELPGFLTQARTSTRDLGAFSVRATPVMRDLRLAVRDLVPAVQVLRPAALHATAVVRALGSFARKARPAVRRLRVVAPHVRTLVAPLGDALRQANPLVDYLSRYGTELGTFFSSAGAATNFYDAAAAHSRVAGVASRGSLVGVVPPRLEGALDELYKTGLLGSTAVLGSNPFPPPGRAGDPIPFDGTYPHLVPDPPYTARNAGRGPSQEHR